MNWKDNYIIKIKPKVPIDYLAIDKCFNSPFVCQMTVHITKRLRTLRVRTSKRLKNKQRFKFSNIKIGLNLEMIFKIISFIRQISKMKLSFCHKLKFSNL